jgi:hypothetical protein
MPTFENTPGIRKNEDRFSLFLHHPSIVTSFFVGLIRSSTTTGFTMNALDFTASFPYSSSSTPAAPSPSRK